MDKEAKDGGPIEIRNIRRWPLDSKAVQFLTMTASAYSINELMEVKKPYIFKFHPCVPKNPACRKK
jgi:hypothetical protein